jgi:hypothetical protein
MVVRDAMVADLDDHAAVALSRLAQFENLGHHARNHPARPPRLLTVIIRCE